MSDETDTTSHVEQVLATHYDGAIRMDAWVCSTCGAPLAMPTWDAMVEGTTGPLLRKAMAKHQADLLAEAGLLRGRAWVDELNAARAEVERARTAHATNLGNLGQSIILLVERIGAMRTLADQLDQQAAHLKGLGVPVIQTAGQRIRAVLDGTTPATGSPLPKGATWTGSREGDRELFVPELRMPKHTDIQRDGYGQGYSTSDPALLVSGHRIDAVQTTSTSTTWYLRCLAPHKRCEPFQGKHIEREERA